MAQEDISFKEFQDCCECSHIGPKKRILNIHAATNPPSKYQLNPTYGRRVDVI